MKKRGGGEMGDCEKARLAFFFVSMKHFDFNCETESSKNKKIETARQLSEIYQDCETHITAKKRDRKTREQSTKILQDPWFL